MALSQVSRVPAYVCGQRPRMLHTRINQLARNVHARVTDLSRRDLLGSLTPCLSSCCGRNAFYDKVFANNMARGMDLYENQLASVKQNLFDSLFSPGLTVTSMLEVGMGSGPNFKFYKQQQQQQQQSTDSPTNNAPDTAGDPNSSSSSSLTSIIGLDPNPAMQQYARENALAQGLQDIVQLVEGSVEALPYPDNSFDAVVCTLVLCSVPNPKLAVAEMLRVLKPGGRLAVLEHVLAPPDQRFIRASQGFLNPVQRLLADGCNLNRDTMVVYREAGFGKLEVESFEAKGLFVIAPHIVGIATK